MKTIAYVTGHSRGIGRHICNALLENDDVLIHGISRSDNWNHERLTFHRMDLSDPYISFSGLFSDAANAEKIVLVNNAGMLGDMQHVGGLSPENIQKTVYLNFTSVLILTNEFLKKYKDHPAEKVIVNVSTGVTNYPIDGWSLYCSTKAGLEMFCRVMEKEFEIDEEKNISVFSIAPGKIDTDMQSEIRKADSKGFSMVDDFRGFKEKGELIDPAITGKKYADVIFNPQNYKESITNF